LGLLDVAQSAVRQRPVTDSFRAVLALADGLGLGIRRGRWAIAVGFRQCRSRRPGTRNLVGQYPVLLVSRVTVFGRPRRAVTKAVLGGRCRFRRFDATAAQLAGLLKDPAKPPTHVRILAELLRNDVLHTLDNVVR
jgi:hypothetical protein